MNKVKEIKLDQTNWLELTIINENNEAIHCESFGDIDEYTELLKQRCAEFGVELSEEHLDILTEQKANRHIPTEEEIAEELAKQEEYRVQSIKLTAQSLVLSKYSLEKQSSANLGIYGEEYLQEMKDYISNIIRISNEAEANGMALEDIDWGVL